jgi:hypothetical protein
VPLQCHFAFFDEHLGCIGFFLSNPLTLEVGVCLGETETEDDDQDWWAGAEPEQWAPSVAYGIDEGACEDRSHKIAEGITLL